MLTSYLDSKFSSNKRVPLSALVVSIRSNDLIPSGTLVLMASGDRRLRLKVLDHDTPHKGFSQPLLLNDFAVAHKVTAHYLLWYLSQEPVANYLVQNATGAVFLRVPRKLLLEVPVPLPTRVRKISSAIEYSPVKTNNEFSRVIAELNNDYLLNVKNGRVRTALILAGATCEVILYQLLIEQGVKPSLLKDDRGLGFNKLLDYVRVLRLDAATGFPMSQLVEIQRHRNQALHAGLLLNRPQSLSVKDLECFNPVVKYFGL
jgi:hypothetical protein